MKKAVLYTRLNHLERPAFFQEVNLRIQKGRAKKYAKKVEIEIVKHFEDHCLWDDDFARPMFIELMEYIYENNDEIDILLLHRDDYLGEYGQEKRIMLIEELADLRIILWQDHGETEKMTDEIFENILESQKQDVRFANQIAQDRFKGKSEVNHGKVIKWYECGADWRIDLNPFCDYQKMHVHKFIYTKNSTETEDILMDMTEELEAMGNDIGFTIVTNSQFLFRYPEKATKIISDLTSKGLKKIIIPMFCLTLDVEYISFVLSHKYVVEGGIKRDGVQINRRETILYDYTDF